MLCPLICSGFGWTTSSSTGSTTPSRRIFTRWSPTFVQGDLSINEYYRKFKAMADGLADLNAPVDDRILVLNILRGLNQCFKHMSSIIQHYSRILNFLKF
jgi:hypothetical protein